MTKESNCAICNAPFTPTYVRHGLTQCCSSQCGRIKSRQTARKSLLRRFEAKFIKSPGCWEWTASKRSFGYGQILVCEGDRYLIPAAHRVSYQLYVGPIPEGMQVCHKCDNPGCVNPTHLFLGTQKDNMLDMQLKGRKVSVGLPGEKNHKAKATAAIVLDMRAQHAAGKPIAEIADDLGFARALVDNAIKHRTWRHI